MDYNWIPGLCVRNIFCVSNDIEPLDKSILSNHIGINGFVKTVDNKLVFVKRYGDVSIGKYLLGCSVGASLKVKYALNEDNIFTLRGLQNAIISEVKDELSIGSEHYNFSVKDNIVSIYRDLLEGGKPQILFYIECSLDSKNINKNFKTKKTDKKLQRDGNKLIFVDVKELNNIEIGLEKIKINNKYYRTLPSVGASLIMIMKEKQAFKKGI